MKLSEVFIKSNPERYFVVEMPGSFRVWAFLSQDPEFGQVLSLNLALRNDYGGRSKTLRGSEEFAKALSHFEGKFSGILANWITAVDSPSDNLNEINKLTGPDRNIPLSEAINQTWTAKQAAKAGYHFGTVVTSKGTPGSYTQVKVIFRKSENTPP